MFEIPCHFFIETFYCKLYAYQLTIKSLTFHLVYVQYSEYWPGLAPWGRSSTRYPNDKFPPAEWRLRWFPAINWQPTRLFVYHYHFLHNRPSPFKKTQHKVNTSTSRGLWFLYDGHQAAFLPHLCVPLADRGAGTDHHTHPPSPHPESRLVVENDIFKIISIYSL